MSRRAPSRPTIRRCSRRGSPGARSGHSARRSVSSLRHAHTKQDEFVYILEGHPTLVTDEGRTPLAPGMCAGFKCGMGNAHHLVNETDADVLYLEIGDRTPGEQASYPDDDIQAVQINGQWRFARKDGAPY